LGNRVIDDRVIESIKRSESPDENRVIAGSLRTQQLPDYQNYPITRWLIDLLVRDFRLSAGDGEHDPQPYRDHESDDDPRRRDVAEHPTVPERRERADQQDELADQIHDDESHRLAPTGWRMADDGWRMTVSTIHRPPSTIPISG
jgi:hypothetical protein